MMQYVQCGIGWEVPRTCYFRNTVLKSGTRYNDNEISSWSSRSSLSIFSTSSSHTLSWCLKVPHFFWRFAAV
eukprot:2582027-Rhodomonas_salina.2